MITAILIDEKGFKRAEMLLRPEPHCQYRIPPAPTAGPFSEKAGLSEITSRYVLFARGQQLAQDVFEYNEVASPPVGRAKTFPPSDVFGLHSQVK